MLIICYIVLVVMAAVYDVATLKIPNPINAGLVGLFLLRGLVAPWQFAWLDHLAAGAALFGAGLVLFNFRLLGGGDVKLLTAVSLWAGLSTLSAMLVTTAIVGGLLGVSLLLVRPIVSPWLARLPRAWSCWIPVSLAPGAGVPYGLPIAVSAILAC